MIAPTVVGDLFGHEQRSIVFGIFYLAIPVGSALGFLVGGEVAAVTGDWRWAMRVGPRDALPLRLC